jgi:branched-chain amino acid transport system permease protein
VTAVNPSNKPSARRLGLLLLPLTLILLPLGLTNFQRMFVAEIYVWGLFAMSFALVYGFGGMLSFAQAVFFGAGCYGLNLGTFYFGWGTWACLVCAIVAAICVAVPIGIIATRSRANHFLIVTVIFSVLVHMILSSGHWRWITGSYITRSFTFVPDVPVGFATFSYADELVAYYFTLFVVGLIVCVCGCIIASPLGRALLAQRDNELRARLIGLNVAILRFVIFVVAAGAAGAAGALYGLLARYTSLEFFHWSYSGLAVMMAIIGGVNTLIGPFLGTAIYMLLAEHLSRYLESFMVLVGILLIVVVRYAPTGLWGLLQKLALRVRFA